MPVVICPKCSQRLKVSGKPFGKNLKCANCGQLLAIGPGEPADATNFQENHTIFRSKHGLRRFIFAGAAAILLVGVCALGIAIGLRLQRPTTQTRRTGEVATSGASQDVESATAPATAEKKQEAGVKASSPSSMQSRMERYKLASELYEREEAKSKVMFEDCYEKEIALRAENFADNLPKGLTVKGLKIFDVDDFGHSGVTFKDQETTRAADKAAWQNHDAVQKFADQFAKECSRPESPIAQRLKSEVANLPCKKELQEHYVLVRRLKRERDEAQAELNK
jgi:hypothetical protein